MTDDPKRKPKYWSALDQERFTCEAIEDAVGDYLDDIDPAKWPATVEVVGYAPLVLTIAHARGAECLYRLIEYLDETYGDPDGDGIETSAAMEAAERRFYEAVLAEYQPWACEKVCRETVDVLTWARDQSGWQDDPAVQAAIARLEVEG